MKGKGNGKGGNRDQEEHGLGLDGVITDKRFVHLHSDPRFMRLPRNNSKVSIDSRFNRMFSDKNFSESSSLAFDKRGKPKKKSETHKLHQFYYHLHQDEEDEENEDGANEQAEKNDETNTGKTQKKIDEGNTNKQKEENAVGFLSNANSTQISAKGRKNRNKDRAKQGEILIGFSDNVSADEHGQENTHGWEALDIVTTAGVDDPKKKKKKKKKDHEMDDRLVDLDQKLYAKEIQEDSMVGELKEIKKKKNKMRLDRDMCTDEAHEINQAVKLKKKKKRDSGNNNSLPTLAEKMYMSEGEADIRGVEHVKEKKDQVRAHLEVAARIASGSCKSNSTVGSTSKKKGDGSRPKRSGENVCVEESDVIELSRRGDESDDRKKCKSKQDSIVGAGRKGSTAVEEFQKKDHRNEEDQETSESESFADEYFDVSESEQNETSSSSDDDDNYEDQIEPELPEQEEVPTLDCETRRLAVVNMDWNHIKAVDLLVCMNSFLPKGGQILTVSVYPSEFGLKQMAEEAVRGPALFGSDDESSEDDQDELENEKLRQYEKDRLRYYFAVIECDSSATSGYLYKACDGVEFERTSNVLDLRFIPDDMQFDPPPRDIATEVPTNYLAPDFHTRALQHSKVNIGWDDDEPLRVKTLHRKFDEAQLNEMDFKAYLASDDEVSDGDDDDDDDADSEENGEDGENKRKGLREKYRALLLESENPSEGRDDKDDKDMEITFNTGLEELSKRILEKSKKNNSELTVWEAYLQKRSEKRRAKKKLANRSSEDETGSSDGEDANDEEKDNQSDDFFIDDESLENGKKTGLTVNNSNVKKAGKKETKLKSLSKEEEDASKAELELLLADDHGFENGVRGYNLKAKKSKGRKQDMPSEDKLPTVDCDDPRFSALFTSHHFAIDPTDPQFKRSATYSRSIVQKQQKKFAVKTVDDLKPFMEKKSTIEDSSTKKRKTELLSLVKSVKRKVGAVDL